MNVLFLFINYFHYILMNSFMIHYSTHLDIPYDTASKLHFNLRI